jgi:hypothetical protein
MVRQAPDGTWLINNCTRDGIPMCDAFQQHPITINARLTFVEVVALRLYTGPMFHKYNTHLRGLSEATTTGGAPQMRAKKERRYVTTIHAIASALKKVARVTELPEVSSLSLSLSLSGTFPSHFIPSPLFGSV